jgi:hypothetical protein
MAGMLFSLIAVYYPKQGLAKTLQVLSVLGVVGTSFECPWHRQLASCNNFKLASSQLEARRLHKPCKPYSSLRLHGVLAACFTVRGARHAVAKPCRHGQRCGSRKCSSSVQLAPEVIGTLSDWQCSFTVLQSSKFASTN